MPTDVLGTPLQFLKGVGPRRAADLEKIGLTTIEDLLCRFPVRYEDRGQFALIATLRPGARASVQAEVLSAHVRPTRRPGFRIFEMVVRDGSGSIRAVFPNQTFLKDVFKPHQRVILYGSVELRPGTGLQLASPDYEILSGEAGAESAGEDDQTVHTGRIVPIYEKAGTLTPKMQRALVHQALQSLGPPGAEVDDPLPAALRRKLQLPERRGALEATHFPPEGASADDLNAFRTPAQQRLIFEEFFLFQAGLLLKRRRQRADRKRRSVVIDDRVRDAARAVLPFRLTGDQKRAVKEIVDDMARPEPMNRLLQGDVGAGKTIVALLSALVAMENGFQVAFMAPTEILADQHFMTIRRRLEASRFRVASLTGAVPARRRREILAELQAGSIHMVIGTHALAEDAVAFRELGLIVIDEQHRFGVVQRAALRAKGANPDVLVMTATPIPRTLSMTLYGDLDVSIIREMPPGRQPVRTTAKPESRREEAYRAIHREVDAGRQAYIIYPLVEDSEKVDLRAATAMAEHLASAVFPQYRVALLHGRLKQDQKDHVMASFAAGETHVLVSTTVVEVGVDVPNATVMIVEHAERFGLSQLHQLRGRVGRSAEASECMLLYQPPLTETGKARLQALVDTNDGFVIAERDLELRGPGDFFGTRQSGLPTFRVGDLGRDALIMEEARREATDWIATDAGVAELAGRLRHQWKARFGLAEVG
ncbi:MAG: ATP-dependent DNA helicase RecG [Acidobacteriota bacterium]|nr:ATP-dependent DNA helicase RecG [Acidobacteriota bacterium]